VKCFVIVRYESLRAAIGEGVLLGAEATTNKNIYDVYLKSKFKSSAEKPRD
jgi:hypothetical protein